MPHKNKILITGFFVIITIASLFVYWIKSKENTFSDEIISKASSAFKVSLNSFLVSASESISEINSNIQKADGEQFKSTSLNVFFSKMILKDKYLKGVILVHNNFSYIIYRDNSTWAMAYDLNLADSVVNWSRLNNKLDIISNWTDTYNFFSDDLKSIEINKPFQNSKFIWKTSKSQLSDKGDLLTNFFQTNNNAGEKIIAGLIFSTKKMSKTFISVLKFEYPLVSIITSNNTIVTPIVTSDTTVVSRYNVLKPKITEIVDSWRKNQDMVAHSYSFEQLNQKFWSRIDNIGPNTGVVGFAVTISATDLAETEKRQEQIYLYLSISLFVITLVLAFIFFRKKKSNNSSTKNNELIAITKAKVKKLIDAGETEYVEFKSSIRWDYREEKVNKILEFVILKSIAAFANAKGGILFIGVSDDLKILGLEKDFSTLKKQDADYFELHSRKLINNQYGIAFSNENILMEFHVFDGKTICSIQIKASEHPVFLKSKNKQGQEIEKFYVRSGNSSQEISSMKEVNEYIKIRFT